MTIRTLERKTAPAAPPRDRRRQPKAETKQRIIAPFEVKKTDAEARTFEGYLSTWALDLGHDVIHKGAFARTIEHFTRGAKKIPLVDSHNYNSIFSALGTLVDAREDDVGLWTKWRVVDGDDGDRVLNRISGGVIGKMSIGYIAVRYDYGKMSVEGVDYSIRNLYEVKLEEGSLVLFPMNEGADVDPTSVKSIAELLTAAQAGTLELTDEQKSQFRALLDPPTPPAPDPAADEVKGLAPDDPQRLQLEELLRDVTLRSLGTVS